MSDYSKYRACWEGSNTEYSGHSEWMDLEGITIEYLNDAILYLNQNFSEYGNHWIEYK